jgi:hypothetical protein
MNIYHSYIKANPDKNNAEICDLVLAENEALRHLPRKSIMRRLQSERRIINGDNLTTVTNLKMKATWVHEPDSKNYSFDFDGELYVTSEEVVSYICANYTQPSAMTAANVATEASRRFAIQMTESFVTKVIQVFGMTKTSPPFAPHEVIGMDSDKLTEALISRRRQKIEELVCQDNEVSALKKALGDEIAYNRKLKDYVKDLGYMYAHGIVAPHFKAERIEEFDKKREDLGLAPRPQAVVLEGNPPRPKVVYTDVNRPFYRSPPRAEASPHRFMHVVFCDWHIGKKTNSYNKEVAKERTKILVDEIVSHAIAQRVSGIHVHIDGDMVDGPSGTMHPEQWLHQDVHLHEQIEFASTLIADAILAIHIRTNEKVKSIMAIGGNHGRFAPDRADEPTRMADVLTYNMVQLKINSSGKYRDLAAHMTITSKQDMYLWAQPGICIVGHHGDKLQKDIITTIWEIRETNPYIKSQISKDTRTCWIWLHGHLHCNVFEEVQTNVYSIRGGSMAGPDEYSLRIGKGARPSQMAFVHDKSRDSISPIWIPLD